MGEAQRVLAGTCVHSRCITSSAGPEPPSDSTLRCTQEVQIWQTG